MKRSRQRRAWLCGATFVVAAVTLPGCQAGQDGEMAMAEKDIARTAKGSVQGPLHVVTRGEPRMVVPMADVTMPDSLLKSMRGGKSAIIGVDEQFRLSTGLQQTKAIRAALAIRLKRLGFEVIDMADQIEFSPSLQRQDELRRETGANLAVLVKARTDKAETDRGLWCFQSEMSGKVVNLTTHEAVASRAVLKRGGYAPVEMDAAGKARTEALADLAGYLAGRIDRNWMNWSLLSQRLTITNIADERAAYRLRDELRKRDGICTVAMEKWDRASGTAHYHVQCHFQEMDSFEEWIGDLLPGPVRFSAPEH